MVFVTGHKTRGGGGKKGRSGRKKSITTIVREAMDKNASHLPALFDKLLELALAGDREAAIYLLDRSLGKPKQDTMLDISGGEELSAGLVTQLFAMLAAKRRELEANPMLLPEGVTQDPESVTNVTHHEPSVTSEPESVTHEPTEHERQVVLERKRKAELQDAAILDEARLAAWERREPRF